MYAKFLKIVHGHFSVFLTKKTCHSTLFITPLTEVEERNLASWEDTSGRPCKLSQLIS